MRFLKNILSIIVSVLVIGLVLIFTVLPNGWVWHKITNLWEDEYANVDWDKRLEGDVEICMNLLNPETKLSDTYKYNRDIEQFSKEISKYPKDKLDYLKGACRYTIKYTVSVSNDLLNSFEIAFSKMDTLVPLTFSAETLGYIEAMRPYKKLSEVLESARNDDVASFKESFKQIAVSILFSDEKKTFADFKKVYIGNIQKTIDPMKESYEKLFGEKFN